MPVAADTSSLEVGPSLEEVRELAADHTLVPLRHEFIADVETPVSAYLKLRGSGPSFLLESAEQGQRFGRWSFLGVQPRSVIRLEDGDADDRRAGAALRRPLRRGGRAGGSLPARRALRGLPPFAGGAVGLFGYDLVRYRGAERRRAEPRPGRAARPRADDLRRPARLRPPPPPRDRARATSSSSGDLEAGYRDAVAAIAAVRERLAAPVPRSRPPRRARRSSSRTSARRAMRRPSSGSRSTSAPATSTRSSPASAGPPSWRSTRSRSTAGCARSTRARTCTSSTSRTSRSRAPRRRRS